MEIVAVTVDWGAGVKREEAGTPEQLRASAKEALKRASEWVGTSERLLAKAEDLQRQIDAKCPTCGGAK